MRFRQIEVFHAVYTSGSISAAARALHVSQPSVSKVLHHAEQQLGFDLFKLVRGRLVATDEAHELFVEVSEVFKRVQSLRKTVSNLQSIGDARIRIAVVPSLGLHVAPLAISRFRKRFPQVGFDVYTLHHDEVFEALYERRCEVAFGYEIPTHPRLRRRDLASGELVLMLRREDWPGVADRIALERLEGREVVGLGGGGPLAELFARALAHAGVSTREVVSNQTFYVAAALTGCGAGMSVVDGFTALALADGDTLHRPFDPELSFKVQCAHLEDRMPSTASGKFINVFAKVLREVQGQA